MNTGRLGRRTEAKTLRYGEQGRLELPVLGGAIEVRPITDYSP